MNHFLWTILCMLRIVIILFGCIILSAFRWLETLTQLFQSQFFKQSLFIQQNVQLFYLFIYRVCPVGIQFLYLFQLLQGLLHLPQRYLILTFPLLVLSHRLYFFKRSSFIMQLCKVKPCGGLISNHDGPLQIIGLDILQIIKHFEVRIRLVFKGIDYILNLLLILLFHLQNLFFEESEKPVHFLL